MNNVSPFRLGLVIAVTVISAILTVPTVLYFNSLRSAPAETSDAFSAWEQKTEKLRSRAIPLGLDLRGGVDVTLKIDDAKIETNAVKALVTTLKNAFNDKQISAAVGETEDGKSISIKILEKAQARDAFQMLNTTYKEEIEGDYSQARLEAGEEVRISMNKAQLAHGVDQGIQGALKIVRDRLDQFGLTQPSIAMQGRNQIRIQVPGIKDPEKLINNITKLATMEFRLTHEHHGTSQDPIGNLIDDKGQLKDGAQVPLGYELVNYKFGHVDEQTKKIVYREGKMLVEKEVRLTGASLRAASVQRDQFDLQNPIKVGIQFDNQGAETFAKLTEESVKKAKADGTPRNLAILLDGVVISAPRLGVIITGGSAVIEGGFTFDEAQDLAYLLKGGSLPAPLVPESKRTIGASLGTESIISGVRALVWGTVAIVTFMVFYYAMAGVIAVIALFLNVLMVLAILALSQSTLTLSGIGGILLTIGMAVDANVLIYERIREELDGGRSLRQAIALGYDRAFSVIVDSHMTTLVTALVLLQFAEGSVRGFALSMTFGLIANLYTGLTVTHVLCSLWFGYRNSLSLGVFRMFKNTKIQFIKTRWISLGGSGVVIAIMLVLIVARGGLDYGVDFAGGLLAEANFTKPTTEHELRTLLQESGLHGEKVQAVPGTDSYVIRVKTVEGEPLTTTEQMLRSGLEKKYPGGFKLDRVASFGAETGQGFRDMAIMVVLLSSSAILLYLWFRFELVFGAAAVIALLHDLVLTVLICSLWGVEISLDSVAAMLVMLGFSVNDTIVNFDRLRENSHKEMGKSFGELCDLSLNQCLSRTIITSGTVFLVVTVMLLIGGEGLSAFSKVMFVGSIAGTYSSVFIATPIVFEWNRRQKDRLVTALREKGKSGGPESAPAPQTITQKSIGNVPRTPAV